MNTLVINKGTNTDFVVDLTDYDFTNVSAVRLTVKNINLKNPEAVFTREFTTPELHNVEVSAEESELFNEFSTYDFVEVNVDGTYKATDNGKILLRKGVGK